MMSKMDDVLDALSGRTRKINVKKTATGLGTGLALGALAGLLFAPRPGRETREEIVRTAEKGAKVVKDKAGVGAQYVSEAAQDVAQMAKDKAGTLKRKMKRGADKMEYNVDRAANRAEKTVSDIADDVSEMADEEVVASMSVEDPHIEAAEFNRR